MTIDDAEPLLDSVTGPDEWAWKPVPQPRNVAEMCRVLATNMLDDGSGTRAPWVVVRRSDGRVIGSTTLFDLDFENRRVEMGWTWLSRPCWGQGYNEDMKASLLAYCFEVLGMLRVAWSADSLNTRSNRQLQRCGFVNEGTFRSYGDRADGTRQDRVWYSLLTEEWPATRQRLHALIDTRSDQTD
jgi:RimJ/RimL family protein N-acetyltransferase